MFRRQNACTVTHFRQKFQPRVDETLRWKVAADPADPADQVSSAAVRNHSITHLGGEDYVSSNQTPSNNFDDEFVLICTGFF